MDNEIRLIDANALKKFIGTYDGTTAQVEAVEVQYIDNAPTVDTTCPNCDSGYAQGYSDGYLKGKEERPIDDLSEYSDKLWKKAYERGKAEGRKTGHWIKTDNMLNIWKCSECNEEWCSEVGGNPLEYDYHYCPNCGASMLKEAENEID